MRGLTAVVGATSDRGVSRLEFQDYLRAIRRGWVSVVVVILVCLIFAGIYVSLVPRRYTTSTSLYVSASTPTTVDDLERASNFSTKAVTTYASLIDSASVLDPVSREIEPPLTVDDLSAMVATNVPTDTTLINVNVSGGSREQVAPIANAVAETASRVLPNLETNATGRPLVRIQQTSPAVEPLIAVSPNVRQTIAIAFVLGLCLGLGGTIARQSLDTRIRTRDDVRKATPIPLLAAIPHSSRSATSDSSVIIARDEPSSVAGESFRTLRTNLGFIDGWDRRSLVFTSVGRGTSDAHVAVSTAWTMAQTGRSVVLVDADMRESGVSNALGLSESQGLADVLAGQADFGSILQEQLRSALQVIPAGRTSHSPSDLLGGTEMARIIRQLERDYDYVIVSAPPLLSCADAAIIAGATGGTVISLVSGRSKVQDLDAAASALAIVRVKPVGVVLTGRLKIGAEDFPRVRTEPQVGGPPQSPSSPSYDSLESPTLRQRPIETHSASHGGAASPSPRARRTG